MNYKQMLEKFAELEAIILAQDQRIKMLEAVYLDKQAQKAPKFTPGTAPSFPAGFWSEVERQDPRYQSESLR